MKRSNQNISILLTQLNGKKRDLVDLTGVAGVEEERSDFGEDDVAELLDGGGVAANGGRVEVDWEDEAEGVAVVELMRAVTVHAELVFDASEEGDAVFVDVIEGLEVDG